MTQAIIRALSPETIHKIAAGEVIERPANAVKELVENALDARAGKITVALEEGGLDLIRVIDNGTGMTKEDARAAWLPHTTSKIREAGDLSRVSTYGFRGEALCSLAAVAEVAIETRHASEETGIAVSVSESRETGVREITRNPGATVTVKNLFLHTPARRKFMGSSKSETTRILNMLGRVALAHPGTGFKVIDKGREILSLVEGSLKHRVGEILGFNITNELAPVDWSDGAIHVEGFVSTAQQARQRASHQYFYINRRSIQSGMLSRAVSQSYEVLPPGRFPMAVIFLTMTPEEVDVNVHPTKKEVRFLNESRIYWAVTQAVKNALRKSAGAPELDLAFGSPPGPAELGNLNVTPGDYGLSAASGLAAAGPALAPVFAYAPPDEGAPALVAEAPPDAPGNQIHLFSAPTADPQIPPSPSRLIPTEEPDDQSGVRARGPESPAVPYLQLHNGFILFGVQSGLMMVNQQAAHERILYEKALEEMRRPGRFSSQQLLFPEVVEFPPGDSLFLEEHLAHLQALGFDLEAFGGNAFQLRGLPVEVRPEQAKKVMYDLVQGLLRPERGAAAQGSSRGEEFPQRLARVYARVTSVRLGEPLDYPQISALMDGLFGTQNPYVSPSGTPIVVRVSMDEIHRKFGLK